MNCPYCAEEIKDEALACKHCNRDLFLFTPLMKEIGALSKRVAELEDVIDAVKRYGYAGEPKAVAETVAAAEAPPRPRTPPAQAAHSAHPTLAAPVAMFSCIAALVFAHFLVVIVYDTRLVYLAVASMVLPLVFGYLMKAAPQRSLAVDFVSALGIAIVSILIMNFIMDLTYHIPFLPQDAEDWREDAEYGASIAFGFFAGVLGRRWYAQRHSPEGQQNRLASDISRIITKHRGKPGEFEFEKTLKSIETSVGSVMAISAAAISVATGLVRLIN